MKIHTSFVPFVAGAVMLAAPLLASAATTVPVSAAHPAPPNPPYLPNTKAGSVGRGVGTSSVATTSTKAGMPIANGSVGNPALPGEGQGSADSHTLLYIGAAVVVLILIALGFVFAKRQKRAK